MEDGGGFLLFLSHLVTQSLKSLTPPAGSCGGSTFRTNNNRPAGHQAASLAFSFSAVVLGTGLQRIGRGGAWLRRVTAWDRDVWVFFPSWHVFVMLVFWARHAQPLRISWIRCLRERGSEEVEGGGCGVESQCVMEGLGLIDTAARGH